MIFMPAVFFLYARKNEFEWLEWARKVSTNITITLILRALQLFDARVFSFAARRVIYARREAEGINDAEGCKWKNKGVK